MKTVNIKGKEYVMVNERIKEFRTNYPNYSLESELVSLSDDNCVIRAVIKNEEGKIIATGLAQEDRTSSMINKTSYVENCETSAWGRALGNFGIGIDISIASAEEMQIAIAKQEEIKSKEIVGGKYTFTSGQYKGKTIEEVGEIDEDYLLKLAEWTGVSKTIKDNIEMYLKFDNRNDVNI